MASTHPGNERRRQPRKTLKGQDMPASGPGNSSESGPDEREIAENAYYRAEKRGFTPGQEERDWLEAEAEIKARRKRR